MPRPKRTVKIVRSEAREDGPDTSVPPEPELDVESSAQLRHYGKLADIALKTPAADKTR